MAVFLPGHALLLASVSGKGEDMGFVGMRLFFASVITSPVVLFGSALLTIPKWKTKATSALVSLALPVGMLVAEWFYLYGK